MIPRRWRIGLLMFGFIAINYLDRVNISTGILYISRDFHLTAFEEGVVLSAFSWGYVLLMIPGGILVDRYGPRIMNAVACMVWSLFTFLTAGVGSFLALLIARFLVGAAEAPIFPGNAKVVSTWFSNRERGRATALFDVGSYVGGALSVPVIVFTMVAYGWRTAFILCSVIGLVWSIVWSVTWIRYYRTPDPNETAGQRQEASKTIYEAKPTGKDYWRRVPRLLRERKIRAISFGFFTYNYLKSFFLTWFPTYLVLERHFTIIKAGLFSLIPPLCAVIGELGAGAITDRLISRGVSTTLARKIPLCSGMILSSVVCIAAFVQSDLVAIGLLSVSFACLIAASASIWAIPGDLAPNRGWVGTIGGVQNAFSNVAGIVAPIVTGALFAITGSFIAPLIVSGLLAVLGAASYWFGVGVLRPLYGLDIVPPQHELEEALPLSV